MNDKCWASCPGKSDSNKLKVLTYSCHDFYMMPLCRMVTLVWSLIFLFKSMSLFFLNVALSQVLLTWLCSTSRAMLMTSTWTLWLQCVWRRGLSYFSLQVAPLKINSCCIVALPWKALFFSFFCSLPVFWRPCIPLSHHPLPVLAFHIFPVCVVKIELQ